MKILIAPDKFKGSLTAAEVASHLGRGLAARGNTVVELPVADGGDGSVQAAVRAGFDTVDIDVRDALRNPHAASMAYDGTTAVIEVANTCGLHTLADDRLQPLRASSHGLGDALMAALTVGARTVVVALGGSASTDGGAGLLQALGMVFLDRLGQPIDPIDGGSLAQLGAVDPSGLVDLAGVEIVAAGDVANPLCGPVGSAAVYASQKGATTEDISLLESGLRRLMRCLLDAGYTDAPRHADTAGAGGAGGLGFAALILGGRVQSGADLFLDLLRFDDHLVGCDLVITGEGRIDDQTAQGKLPAVIARRAAPTRVVAVVGHSTLSDQVRAQMGIDAVYALTDRTEADPYRDSELAAKLLVQLGPTIELEHAHRARSGRKTSEYDCYPPGSTPQAGLSGPAGAQRRRTAAGSAQPPGR